MAENHLNAGQLQQIQKQAQDALKLAVDSLQLRKWAVEQAFSLVSSCNSTIDPETTMPVLTFTDPMALANSVYDFVAQAAVVKVDIGQ